MNTLVEILPRIQSLGRREALRFSNGIRTWIWSYQDLYERISAFAAYLTARGLGQQDKLILWCENRPAWIVVFWAAVARGVVVIPVDPHSSPERIRRIQHEAGAVLIIHDRDASVESPGLESLSIDAIEGLPAVAELDVAPVGENDIVEILYTSGTTSTPKGVVHRHRNICSNLTPIAGEIARYTGWARPFQPIRFLNVIPLSHMFGQSMGIFIPPLLGGAAVFMSELHPAAVTRTIRAERVSVLVCVPRILATLRAEIERLYPDARQSVDRNPGVARRWWRYRRIHSDLGWKFWSFVVGGARLDEDLEAFWSRIGLLVVQGYGLTETSPVVSVNHPFHVRRGTLGTSIGGQEIRVADDGEILVRGPSVAEEYVETGGTLTPATDPEGWFHTGDLGELDPEGRLVYRGRKKDVIVTSDGLNIHPEDVEAGLIRVPGVRDCAVVAAEGREGERPHAVLILAPGTDPATVIEVANRSLEPGQRVQNWSVWPDEALPRTASTGKLQRHRVRAALESGTSETGGPEEDGVPRSVVDVVSEATGLDRDRLSSDRQLDADLGVSSLGRVELLSALEEHYGVQLDEAEFAALETIGEIDAHIERRRADSPGAFQQPANQDRARRVRSPRWARTWIVRTMGRFVVTLVVRPVLAYFVRVETRGAQYLRDASPPVLFAATHTSHLDVPVILRALSGRWRWRVAPAIRQEYFFAPEAGRSRWLLTLEYVLTCAVFNTYPLPQRMGQIRESLRYTGELVGAGHCPLVFPEGRLTDDGSVQTFRPGIGFMASHLQIPVVPLRLRGSFELFPNGARWPRKGTVVVEIGEPLTHRPDESYDAFAGRLEQAVREMQ